MKPIQEDTSIDSLEQNVYLRLKKIYESSSTHTRQRVAETPVVQIVGFEVGPGTEYKR
jgi:hypothetical protein